METKVNVAVTVIVLGILAACAAPEPDCQADKALETVVATARDSAAKDYRSYLSSVMPFGFYTRFRGPAEAAKAIDNMAKEAAEEADISDFVAETVGYDEATATYTCFAPLALQFEKKEYEFDARYTVAPSADGRDLVVQVAEEPDCGGAKIVDAVDAVAWDLAAKLYGNEAADEQLGVNHETVSYDETTATYTCSASTISSRLPEVTIRYTVAPSYSRGLVVQVGDRCLADEAVDAVIAVARARAEAAGDADISRISDFEAKIMDYQETTATYTCLAQMEFVERHHGRRFDVAYTVGPSTDSRSMSVQLAEECWVEEAIDAVVAAARDRMVHLHNTEASEELDIRRFDANIVHYDETTAIYSCAASLWLPVNPYDSGRQVDVAYTVAPLMDSRGLNVQVKPDCAASETVDVVKQIAKDSLVEFFESLGDSGANYADTKVVVTDVEIVRRDVGHDVYDCSANLAFDEKGDGNPGRAFPTDYTVKLSNNFDEFFVEMSPFLDPVRKEIEERRRALQSPRDRLKDRLQVPR